MAEIRPLPENAQPPLIPLTPEEEAAAGRKLADLVRARAAMKREHDAARKDMKEEVDGLEEKIAALASMIRSHGR